MVYGFHVLWTFYIGAKLNVAVFKGKRVTKQQLALMQLLELIQK